MRTNEEFDTATETALGSEYGAFPFPIFMEREVGTQSILNVFEQVGTLRSWNVAGAIVGQLEAGGTTYESAIEKFRWSTYTLDEQFGYGFPTSDVDAHWRQRLQDEGPVGRVPVSAFNIAQNESLEGEAVLKASGSEFIEITKSSEGAGELTFTVTTDDGGVRASGLSTDIVPASHGLMRSALCEAPIRIDFNGRVGNLTVELTDDCPTAVLHLISTKRTGQVFHSIERARWAATFTSTSTTIAGNNIELGLNAFAGLISDDVGLRRVGDPDSEMLAHGCDCEGWGFGNSAIEGSLSGSWAEGLELHHFSSDGVSAESVVHLPDTPFTVSHKFRPSASPDLYEVEVRISAPGPTEVMRDLRYRRAFDWDVNPKPFDEYTTWALGPGGDDSYVTFTSNDGFADTSPRGFLSHLGATGYYQDAGPKDQGGFIEINLGDMWTFDTRVFTFYYGVTTSEAGAIAAVDAVGADLYSLGQTSVGDGHVTGSPFTAVFAMDSETFPTILAGRAASMDTPYRGLTQESSMPEPMQVRRGRVRQGTR